MFGKTDEYLKAYAPSVSSEVPAKKPGSSFALTQLEQMYGQDYVAVLSEAMDDPDLPAEQRLLALELVAGTKTLRKLDASDTSLLDSLTQHSYAGSPRKLPPTKVPKVQETLTTLSDPHVEEEYTVEDLRPYSPKDKTPNEKP